MDSGLLTITAGEHWTFWSAAATLSQLLPESVVPDVIVGLTRDYFTRRRFGFGDAPVLNQGLAVGGKRRRRDACGTWRSGFWQTPLGFPVAAARCGRATLPAHSKTVRNS